MEVLSNAKDLKAYCVGFFKNIYSDGAGVNANELQLLEFLPRIITKEESDILSRVPLAEGVRDWWKVSGR